MKDSPQPHSSSVEMLASFLVCGVGVHTDIWVLEHKLLVELVFYPVHLASNNAEESFAVNQNLHTILLQNFPGV